MASNSNDPRQAVQSVREQIQTTRRERERLAEAPLTKDEVAERVDSWLTEQASRARIDLLASDFAAPGRREGNPFRLPVRRGDQSSVDVGPLMASLFRDQVREAILQELPEDDGAVAMAERPGKLAELEKKIRELERHEENLIVEAEAAGVEIQRRPDASPDVILNVEWPAAAEA
ncbi:hypothetical protein QWY84_11890 [Aquisalimonas lutea]|uniref:hypothetical protein n=1 Tax=Aquisalimonas lutea TaxID=1327750 RepID=UPI0025B5924C|nr:hypothetical protein [Aquisalimonas lutea]MDN3518315.1 hypothetical protein [Aquisalimonas lutea]